MSAFRMHMLFPWKERAGNAWNFSNEYLQRVSQGKTHLFQLVFILANISLIKLNDFYQCLQWKFSLDTGRLLFIFKEWICLAFRKASVLGWSVLQGGPAASWLWVTSCWCFFNGSYFRYHLLTCDLKGCSHSCSSFNCFISVWFCLADKKADCTITMADTDLLALMTGKMNPQTVSTAKMTWSGNWLVCFECV